MFIIYNVGPKLLALLGDYKNYLAMYNNYIVHNIIQWNPSITDTFGEQSFGRYTEVAFVEGLFCVQTLHLGPEYLAVISQLAFLQGWPLSGVPLYIIIM